MRSVSRLNFRCSRAVGQDRRASSLSRANGSISSRFYQSQTAVPAVWGGRMFAPPAAFDPFSSRNLPMANLGSPAQIANRELNARPDLGMSYLMKKSLQSEQGLARVLARDIQQVETANARIHDLNGRVLDVLRDLTGMYLGDDPEIWKAWWADQLGYSYQPSEPVQKPTYTSFATEPPPAQDEGAITRASGPARRSRRWKARERSN